MGTVRQYRDTVIIPCLVPQGYLRSTLQQHFSTFSLSLSPERGFQHFSSPGNEILQNETLLN
jgi:hypothetical protein